MCWIMRPPYACGRAPPPPPGDAHRACRILHLCFRHPAETASSMLRARGRHAATVRLAAALALALAGGACAFTAQLPRAQARAQPAARPDPLAHFKSWEEAWAALSPYGLSAADAAVPCNSSGPTAAASCGVSWSGWHRPLPQPSVPPPVRMHGRRMQAASLHASPRRMALSFFWLPHCCRRLPSRRCGACGKPSTGSTTPEPS